jgi:hypothetical protein
MIIAGRFARKTFHKSDKNAGEDSMECPPPQKFIQD